MSAVTSVFVFGITGQQGSSVAKSLLEAGVKVVGLSRSPDSDKAKGKQSCIITTTDDMISLLTLTRSRRRHRRADHQGRHGPSRHVRCGAREG